MFTKGSLHSILNSENSWALVVYYCYSTRFKFALHLHMLCCEKIIVNIVIQQDLNCPFIVSVSCCGTKKEAEFSLSVGMNSTFVVSFNKEKLFYCTKGDIKLKLL